MKEASLKALYSSAAFFFLFTACLAAISPLFFPISPPIRPLPNPAIAPANAPKPPPAVAPVEAPEIVELRVFLKMSPSLGPT